jgi:methionine synthase II (cobalamin-independent)
MREVLLPIGLASAVGSLPHDDVAEAVEFALALQPRLPAAPSLPQMSPVEGMIPQAAWGIEGVLVLPDGSLLVDEAAVEPDAPLRGTVDDAEPFASLRAFLEAIVGRVAPFKIQLTGPVTLGLALHAVGVPARRAFTVAGRAVCTRVGEVLQAARRVAPGATPLVFLDEPGLTAVLEPGFPLGVDDTLDLVSSALAAVEDGAIAGLHCCGRADWPAVLQAGPQMLSLPVDAGATDHPGAFADFLDRGGWLAWGAVPTDRPLGETAEILWRRMAAEWDALADAGCDPRRIVEQALVTPACGLVGLDTLQAAHVLDLTNHLARRVEARALELGLTLGA